MSARTEADSMGEMEIPADALYGAQTARAVRNFQVSGEGIGREMIRALGQIKAAAARVNGERGLLDAATAGAIGFASTRPAKIQPSSRADYVTPMTWPLVARASCSSMTAICRPTKGRPRLRQPSAASADAGR